MDIDSCLEKHSAALGDSPAGLPAAAAWKEVCSRMGFDSLCLRLDEAGGAADLLTTLRNVMEATLNDMTETSGGTSDIRIDDALAGTKRKKSRTPFIPKKEKETDK